MAQVAVGNGAASGMQEVLSGVVHWVGIWRTWPGSTRLGLEMLLKLAMSQMPELYCSARELRVLPATMVWLTVEVAPQGSAPAGGELVSGFWEKAGAVETTYKCCC
jgi:hypothetical protein